MQLNQILSSKSESDSPGIFLWEPWNKNNMSRWGLLWTSLSCWYARKKRWAAAAKWEMMLHNLTHSACSPILTAFNRNLCICRSFNTFSWKLWKLLKKFDSIWDLALTSWPCLFPLSSRSYFSVSNLITVSHNSFALLFNCSVSRPGGKGLKKLTASGFSYFFIMPSLHLKPIVLDIHI